MNPAPGMPLRVMVVDDHAVVRHGLSALLAADPDLEVVAESSDGEGVAAIVSESMPDVILMDVGLPTLDGYAATRILKGDPLTRNIPIIAVTGFAMKMDKERALQAGCDAYLTKPIAPRTLLAEVESIVGKHPKP